MINIQIHRTNDKYFDRDKNKFSLNWHNICYYEYKNLKAVSINFNENDRIETFVNYNIVYEYKLNKAGCVFDWIKKNVCDSN